MKSSILEEASHFRGVVTGCKRMTPTQMRRAREATRRFDKKYGLIRLN